MGTSKINNDNYITIQGWMVNKLNLKGNSLLIYAIIFGFTQDNESWFTGSLTYLQDWLGVSKNTVRNALDLLVNKGLIYKDTQSVNGIIYNRYRNSYSVSKIDTPTQKKAQPYQNLDGGVSKFDNGVYQNLDGGVSKFDNGVYQNLDGGVSKIDPNNKEYNILDNINNNIHTNEKKAYDELNNVMLTFEEYQKLEKRNLLYLIENLSFYIASTGKKYKSHYATICQWANKDKKNPRKDTKRVGEVI